MRKVGDLMKELGFNEEAAEGAKVAFIKNLVRHAYGTNGQVPQSPASPTRKKRSSKLPDHLPQRIPQQLSFDLDGLQPIENKDQKRKSG